MKFYELLDAYYNQGGGHERNIGRYWSSEIHSMIKGYLKPEKFFEKSKIDKRGQQMIAVGEMAEDKLKDIFDRAGVDYEYNIKTEMDLGDGITLVVKPDFIFKDFIIETKFPFRLFPLTPAGIPERYKFQLEAEYRSLYKQVYLGVLSIPFDLKLIPYTPSKMRWRKIQDTLTEFHKKLCQLKEESKI